VLPLPTPPANPRLPPVDDPFAKREEAENVELERFTEGAASDPLNELWSEVSD
jgi:hypothetical protein